MATIGYLAAATVTIGQVSTAAFLPLAFIAALNRFAFRATGRTDGGAPATP